MIKVFYCKLAILFLVIASASFLIAFVAILPSYFLSLERINIVNLKIEKQKSEPMPSLDQKTFSIIRDLNKKLGLIRNTENNKFTISGKVINAILLKKMSSVKITNISYESNSKNGSLQSKKISIQGTAPSREILLLFRQALENSPYFKQVDLPISNFIKGSNIQFYLSLIPS